MLSLIKRSQKTFSSLASVMQRAPQELINLTVTAESKLRFYTDDDIKAEIKAAENELGDGGRIVVRPSGTEPLIRVMTEGSDEALITKIAHRVANFIVKTLS
jgi:phosphoglucosamine mutase